VVWDQEDGLESESEGKMGPPADKVWVEKYRRELKIANVGVIILGANQSAHHENSVKFNRLVEMLILLHLDPVDTRAARAFRLQVKERPVSIQLCGLSFSTSDAYFAHLH